MRSLTVGYLPMTMTAGKFKIGHEIMGDNSGALGIVLTPLTASGNLYVYVISGTFDIIGEILSFPNGDGTVTDPATTAGFTSDGLGWALESQKHTSFDHAAFAPADPSAGDIVVFRTGPADVHGGGKVITPPVAGTTVVELYYGTILDGDLCTIAVGADVGSTALVNTPSNATAIRGPSVAVEHYLDGLRRRVVGCKGNLTISAEAGKAGEIAAEWQGTPNLHDDKSRPSGIVYPTISPPRFVNGKAEVDGILLHHKKVELNLNNELARDPDGNHPNGDLGVDIINRDPSYTVDVKWASLGVFDFYAKRQAATLFPGGFLLGTTAGNKIGIAMPKLQVTAVPPGDQDGRVVASIVLKPKRYDTTSDIEAILFHI